MRALFASLFMLFSLVVYADDYQQLYQVAGWPQQQANFSEALASARLRYRETLPPALYQSLLEHSNRRFAPQAMEQRMISTLRSKLPDPEPALKFFQSPVGAKVVAAVVRVTRGDQIERYSQGFPRVEATPERRALIDQLSKVIPASEAGAEVGLALAGVAASSLSQVLPGLFSDNQTAALVNSQRQRLIQQINSDLENSLLYVYRDLSDADLQQYIAFAQSPPGQRYYKSALAGMSAALNETPASAAAP